MSDIEKIIKKLSKLTEKEFRQYDIKFLKNFIDNYDYRYIVQDDDIIYVGLDLKHLESKDDVLEEIEKILLNLKNLKMLGIRYHKNNEVPDFIRNFKNLEVLTLRDCNLNSLPEWLKEFKNLNYLNLEYNNLEILPEWLGTLPNLKSLKVDNNKYLKWNKGNLEILRNVYKRNGDISAPRLLNFQGRYNLPDEQIEIILELEKENMKKEREGRYVNPINIKIEDGKIVEWNMFEYNIKSLHNNFGVFNNLRSLRIANSKLEFLPESFGELKNLESLDISNNKLKSLPESFINLINIKNLNLSNNQFNEIPTQLWALKELIDLNLNNNPFNSEDMVISKKVPDLIKEYLRKKATIKIFISHAVVDFEPYRVEDLVNYLKKQKEISEVYFCESDLAGNIDQWMLDTVQKCQLLLFIATNKSVFNSLDCANELQLADKFSIPIIPLKGDDVNWQDLAEINLSRELGLEYDKENFNLFCENLYKYIENFKQEINLMEKEERQLGITDIYERFRLILDEKFSEIIRKIDQLSDRIAKLEKLD